MTPHRKDPYPVNLYIGNLSYTATEDELKAHFERFGEVTAARIITDRETGRSRGFGFVEMPDSTEAEAAILGTEGKDFLGRELRVNEARPRERE
jgi:RNA recognition motif-containing protein